MGYDLIEVRRDGPHVTVTLDHAAKRNALSLPMMAELQGAFEEIAESDATGVVLAASGPVFSAGHDFADMAGGDLPTIRRLFARCTDMMNAIQAAPQVVVAQVQGLATAAGCQLVATCDLAVASRGAAFAAPGGKGGLFCHTPMVAIARNLGRKRALELALTGDPIDAATALEWGFVNRVCGDAELAETARALLTRATRGSAFSKGLGKRTFYAQIELDQDRAYDYAVEVMSAGASTADGQEGIASFLEKRRPSWRNA
ncbi:MAG: enoyl-CoA hydratase-related protein [Acidimicrobiales bacterium]